MKFLSKSTSSAVIAYRIYNGFKKNYIGILVVTFRIVEPETEEPEPKQPPTPEAEPEQPELPEETSALPAFLLPERRSY